MTAAELRSKSVDELKAQLLDLRKEQLNLRFQKSTGQLENTAASKVARKKIAVIKTVLTEKNKGLEVKSKKTDKPAKTKTETKKTTASKKPADKKEPAKKKKTA